MAREDEDALNWRLIRTPLGEEWSGRARYAAAMHFHRAGEMPEEVLEVYRICSRLDREDPRALLRARGIGADWLRKLEARARGA